MADKPKWGKNGELIGGAKKKARQVKLDVLKALKDNAMNIGVAGLGGAVCAGVGNAIADRVPFLADMKAEGGLKGAVAVGAPALVVAGGGLLIASKTITTPKKAAEAAPWLLGGTVLFTAAPVLVSEVGDRVSDFVAGFLSPAAALPPGGGNAGYSHGVRTGGTTRARFPDEVTPGGGNAGSSHGVRTGGTTPSRGGRRRW